MTATTMRAVLMSGDGTADVVDRPVPTPGPGEVLVQTRASAICRSDMTIYHGNPVLGAVRTGDDRRVPGHEAAGVVVALGEGVTGVAVGDRVAGYLAIGDERHPLGQRGYLMLTPGWRCFGFDVDGGDAEYFTIPAHNALPLPEAMSFEAGAVLTDMVGTQYATQRTLGVGPGDVVAVVGMGPMGSAAVLIAKARGARVIAVDVLDTRLEHARSLGADAVVDSSQEDMVAGIARETGGAGADVVIECSGNPRAQRGALDAAAKLGRVAYVGESQSAEINPSEHLIHKQLTLIGGWYFPRTLWDEIVAFVVEHDIPIEKLISHRFPLEDAAEAFAAFDRRETEKAVFIW
ncbi:MAG: alcohol dehydrogenase [Microbacteriaceae bacterium]|nr:MAG: alcohol dehydrogenase [Microbacteriaceae bacterium]